MAVVGKVEASIDPDAVVADWDVLLGVDRPLTRSWDALRDGQRLWGLRGRVGQSCHLVPLWKTWLQACYVLCVAHERGKVNNNINVESVVGHVQIGRRGDSGGAGAWTSGLSSVHDAGERMVSAN